MTRAELRIGRARFLLLHETDEDQAAAYGLERGRWYAVRIVPTGRGRASPGASVLLREAADGIGFRRRRDLVEVLRGEAGEK